MKTQVLNMLASGHSPVYIYEALGRKLSLAQIEDLSLQYT